MTDRFVNQIIPWLFKWEGVEFENDPDDPGGATKYGIDQRSHPGVDIKNLTVDHATQIYWDDYWTKYCCDHFAAPFDWVFFNACVNCGYGRAQKLLAESEEDVKKFLQAQCDFYKRLAKARPSSQKYLKGWLARTNDLAKTVNIDIS